MSALEGKKLQTVKRLKRFAPLQLSGELSTDEILDLDFVDRPLDFLGRNDVIFEASSNVLAAREKGGKSTLACHLCHGWVVEGRPVLCLSEEWRRGWRWRLEALGIPKGVGHFQVIEGLDKTPQELLQRARRGIEDIVVVDTATWLLGISLANRDEVVKGLKPWVSLTQLGKTVILLAHVTKRGDLAGSHAFGAGVDTILTLEKVAGDPDLRTVKVQGRRLLDAFAIRKTGTTFSLEDLPHEQILTPAQAEVLEVLSTDPTAALTWEEVAAKTGFKEGKTRKILRELVEFQLARDITGSLGSGGRGNAARYILVEDEPIS